MHALEVLVALNERADRRALQQRIDQLVEAYRRNNPSATSDEIARWLEQAGLEAPFASRKE